MIIINGKSIDTNKVNDIIVKDNVVIINGKKFNTKDYSDSCIINI